ncbi:hypothetical protein [Streptomyces decoyicus]
MRWGGFGGSAPVDGPQNGSARVAPAYVTWHTAQVFRGQPRTAEQAVQGQAVREQAVREQV